MSEQLKPCPLCGGKATVHAWGQGKSKDYDPVWQAGCSAGCVSIRGEGTKHIVGLSGGIDSQACARWVLNRYPAEDVILLNSDAGGNEDGMTVEFVNWYSANIHPVVRLTPVVADLYADIPGQRRYRSEDHLRALGYLPDQPLMFPDMAKVIGRFPSSQASFCTGVLKLRPQWRWMKENLSGHEYIRYSGKRRDESRRRRDTPMEEWDGFFDCQLVHPIADWTKEMCFAYVRAHGEKYNALYELGFSRVGCAPCHQANKEDILNWALRRPQNIDKVRAWERQVGRTFFPAGIVPGLKVLPWIDLVVEWAKTSRGGRQSLLPIMHDTPACESKYGLCE